jgi:hypothetical protein
MVRCLREPHGTGTRLTFEHTGFTGVGGFVVSKVLAPLRRKMLAAGLRGALEEMARDGPAARRDQA